MPDYDRLRLDELTAIADFLAGLAEAQWDEPSLCHGWRVRDVVSHMCLGYTTPMLPMVGKVARYRFNVPLASREESIAYGSNHTPAEILAVFRTIPRDNVRKGIARIIKPPEGLVDHVVHHQDIRRPLGMPRTIPPERLLAALEAAPALGGMVASRTRAEGLRFEASDVDWSHGEGPVVTGPGEAILLALCGRPVALDELRGPGVERLRARVAA